MGITVGKPSVYARISKTTQTYAWVDQAGRILKEEGLMGFSQVRTTEQDALKGLAGRADLADLVESTSVFADRTIAHPRSARMLKLRLMNVKLKGMDLGGFRQTLGRRCGHRDPAIPLPPTLN